MSADLNAHNSHTQYSTPLPSYVRSDTPGAGLELGTVYGPRLLPNHAQLLAASAISPEVALARGYQSITDPSDLDPLGFSPAQRIVPGLLIPVHSVCGGVALHQYRPDRPRSSREGKPVKYETPSGSRMHLDLPPPASPWLPDPALPLFVTEGVRKADSAVSEGLCCLALLGVWNWRGTNHAGGKAALPDWECVPLNSRAVYLVFDSDVVSKPSVQQALSRLKAFLESRGAQVLVAHLLSAEGGAKVGLDDFFAAGHSVDDLLSTVRPDFQLYAPSPAETPDHASVQAHGEVPVKSPPSHHAPSQATRLVDLALSGGCSLFHTPERERYATVPVDDHTEVWPLRSRDFKDWLLGRYYTDTSSGPGQQAIQDALAVLEARARFEGPRLPVFTRLAGSPDGGEIFLDLANDRWQAVRVTPHGWEVVDRPPVLFRRPRGMLPLPTPLPGGSLSALRPFVNIRPSPQGGDNGADDAGTGNADWALLAGFLAGALCPGPGMPYPLLVLTGEHGTAKSTLARMIKRLIDPSVAPLRSEPRNQQDLMIAAANSWLLTFDNLSTIPGWLSDSLCRLSTGGGQSQRELYTNSEEVLFDAMRPLVLTSIEDLVTRSDLLDRSLILTLSPIPPSARRAEKELWALFDAAAPRILGGLLDALSTALRTYPSVTLPALPRMADFAHWAVAAEEGLGLEPGRFLRAYRGNTEQANTLALEANPVTDALLEFLSGREEWEGTATELLSELSPLAGEAQTRATQWPKRPDRLSAALRRLSPNLRGIGISVEFPPRTHKQGRLISIRNMGQTGVTGVTPPRSVTPTLDPDPERDAQPPNRDAPTSPRDAQPPECDARGMPPQASSGPASPPPPRVNPSPHVPGGPVERDSRDTRDALPQPLSSGRAGAAVSQGGGADSSTGNGCRFGPGWVELRPGQPVPTGATRRYDTLNGKTYWRPLGA